MSNQLRPEGWRYAKPQPSLDWLLRKTRVTVCAASIFRWYYPERDDQPAWDGPAVIAATDRMFTDMGMAMEYEGALQKQISLGTCVLGLVSGSVPDHTAVIQRVVDEIKFGDGLSTGEIAASFGRHLRAYISDRAEQLYLAPHRMTMESFQATQLTLKDEFVRDKNEQIEAYAKTMDFEALIIGVDKIPAGSTASIIRIDNHGMLLPFNDLGFAAIGIGGTHAAAHFMQAGHGRRGNLWGAMWNTFCAKKRAEAAPGVGATHTDMVVINAIGQIPINQALIDAMEQRYKNQIQRHRREDNDSSAALANLDIPIMELSTSSTKVESDADEAVTAGSRRAISQDASGGDQDATQDAAGPQDQANGVKRSGETQGI